MKPTRELVLRMAMRTFPQYDPAEVLSVLDRYETDAAEGRARVQLAVLFASEGDLNRLRDYIEDAKIDYRDVLGFTPEALREYRAWLRDGE